MGKLLVILAMAVGVLAGCSQKDSASGSVKIDVSSEKDSLQNTLSSAENNIKKGAKEAQAKLEKAGETIKEKAGEAKDKLTDDKKAEVKVEVKN
ncbi:MAG TPA: hypothetical protein VGR78_17600 [Verrucomicrobiae bacterium]|nr:hypothetical protein [Verrucomicrobiae bacterium]